MTLRDILNPWRAACERDWLKVELRSEKWLTAQLTAAVSRIAAERDELCAELDRLKRAPKRDAKGRFVK